MAQPNKPGEMRDVDVKTVSLVGKAANKKKFAIFKSAEDKTVMVDEQEQCVEKSLVAAFKDFFAKYGTAGVEKGEVRNAVARQEKANKFYTAFRAMENVLYRMTDNANWAGLVAAAKEFVEVCEEVANDEVVAKACIEGLEAEKAGKKISSARLAKLKDAHAFLAEIIAEAEAEESKEVEKEDTNMTKEEMQNIIKEALSPVTARLEVIEKAMAETETPAGGEDEGRGSQARGRHQRSDSSYLRKLTQSRKSMASATRFTDTVEKKDEGNFGRRLSRRIMPVIDKTTNRKGIINMELKAIAQ